MPVARLSNLAISRFDITVRPSPNVERWCLEGTPMLTILIIVIIILAIGSAPAWPYSRGWGYYPSGLLGLILLILIVLALTGRL
jgi:hypothetical protein